MTNYFAIFLLLIFIACYCNCFFFSLQNSLQESKSEILSLTLKDSCSCIMKSLKKKKRTRLNELNWLNRWTLMNSIYVSSNLSLTNFNEMYELNLMSCFTYSPSCCFFTCASLFSDRYLRGSIEQHLSLFSY